MTTTKQPDAKNPTPPPTKMMPEGSRKVCVLNGSRQIDQVVQGKWMTLKVLPENGLPKGVYQLGEAAKASTGKDASFTGQVLFSDSKAVYQLAGKGVVEHPRSAFADLEAKGEKVADGRTYTVAYANGKGTAVQGNAAAVTQPRSAAKGNDASM
ncbi:conjugal transfer protein TraB [Pseudomonas oryzihabitans]|uniref:KfrB domain-containing protein n=1 Tax=Pseudomonas oryzihabitans TaxID=47885 RepID=UPI0005CA2097|nr:KfrB domain-containing protein [Pseudomonas oryzihabitans]KIZ48463.1 conjugal transfer protein TraB [Pseudomonas oryzihabitans]